MKKSVAQGKELTSLENSSELQFVFSQLLHCSSPEARRRLPHRYAREYCCLPLGIHRTGDSEFLSVLLPKSLDEQAYRELQFISNCPIVVSTCSEEILRQAIAVLYAKDECFSVGDAASDPAVEHRSPTQAIRGLIGTEDGISRIFRAVLLEAISLRCSDIHIECEDRQARIRFRLQGVLRELDEFHFSFEEMQKLCRHVKVEAGLDIAAPSIPQEGAYELRDSELMVRLRVSCVPTARGEKTVLRLLHNGCLEEISFQPFEAQLSALGIFPEHRAILERFLRAERGSFLVSGPTGSGKSTLLYVVLKHICSPALNVVSIEDPVEAHLPLACQIDVSKLTIGFAEMLVRILRQDPDVLLVGEIRTHEAAHTTLQAAIAGTKVLASIHAGSCFEVVARLLELGISDTLLGLAVHTLSAQRLLPRVCTQCRELQYADPQTELLFQLAKKTVVANSRGCQQCARSGRVAVFEFLTLSAELKSILRSRQHDRMQAFAEQAYSEGYRGYGHYVRELMLQQVVSPGHARAALGI